MRVATARPAPKWFTHLVDLDTGGTLGLAQERTGEAGKSLLNGHESRLRYLAMDLSAPYLSAVPAGVTVIADAFHLVKLANRKIDDAFRRLSYRTEHSHEDLGLPRPLHYMLRRNIESLDPGHLDTIITALDGDGDGQQIATIWIAKEQLRALLALRITKTHVSPAPSQVRDKLAAFYLWCADHQDILEIKTLANTIEKWRRPVIDAVLTVIRTPRQKRTSGPRKWSPGPRADSRTRETRPAVSAWPPPVPPATPASPGPASCHGK